MKFLEELNQFSWNEEELHTYEQALKQQRDARAIEDAKWEDAEKIGREKGIQEGLEKGMEKERNKVVFSMLQNGISMDVVAKITGLSVEQIETLKHSS